MFLILPVSIFLAIIFHKVVYLVLVHCFYSIQYTIDVNAHALYGVP